MEDFDQLPSPPPTPSSDEGDRGDPLPPPFPPPPPSRRRNSSQDESIEEMDVMVPPPPSSDDEEVDGSGGRTGLLLEEFIPPPPAEGFEGESAAIGKVWKKPAPPPPSEQWSPPPPSFPPPKSAFPSYKFAPPTDRDSVGEGEEEDVDWPEDIEIPPPPPAAPPQHEEADEGSFRHDWKIPKPPPRRPVATSSSSFRAFAPPMVEAQPPSPLFDTSNSVGQRSTIKTIGSFRTPKPPPATSTLPEPPPRSIEAEKEESKSRQRVSSGTRLGRKIRGFIGLGSRSSVKLKQEQVTSKSLEDDTSEEDSFPNGRESGSVFILTPPPTANEDVVSPPPGLLEKAILPPPGMSVHHRIEEQTSFIPEQLTRSPSHENLSSPDSIDEQVSTRRTLSDSKVGTDHSNRKSAIWISELNLNRAKSFRRVQRDSFAASFTLEPDEPDDPNAQVRFPVIRSPISQGSRTPPDEVGAEESHEVHMESNGKESEEQQHSALSKGSESSEKRNGDDSELDDFDLIPPPPPPLDLDDAQNDVVVENSRFSIVSEKDATAQQAGDDVQNIRGNKLSSSHQRLEEIDEDAFYPPPPPPDFETPPEENSVVDPMVEVKDSPENSVGSMVKSCAVDRSEQFSRGLQPPQTPETLEAHANDESEYNERNTDKSADGPKMEEPNAERIENEDTGTDGLSHSEGRKNDIEIDSSKPSVSEKSSKREVPSLTIDKKDQIDTYDELNSSLTEAGEKVGEAVRMEILLPPPPIEEEEEQTGISPQPTAIADEGEERKQFVPPPPLVDTEGELTKEFVPPPPPFQAEGEQIKRFIPPLPPVDAEGEQGNVFIPPPPPPIPNQEEHSLVYPPPPPPIDVIEEVEANTNFILVTPPSTLGGAQTNDLRENADSVEENENRFLLLSSAEVSHKVDDRKDSIKSAIAKESDRGNLIVPPPESIHPEDAPITVKDIRRPHHLAEEQLESVSGSDTDASVDGANNSGERRGNEENEDRRNSSLPVLFGLRGFGAKLQVNTRDQRSLSQESTTSSIIGPPPLYSPGYLGLAEESDLDGEIMNPPTLPEHASNRTNRKGGEPPLFPPPPPLLDDDDLIPPPPPSHSPPRTSIEREGHSMQEDDSKNRKVHAVPPAATVSTLAYDISLFQDQGLISPPLHPPPKLGTPDSASTRSNYSDGSWLQYVRPPSSPPPLYSVRVGPAYVRKSSRGNVSRRSERQVSTLVDEIIRRRRSRKGDGEYEHEPFHTFTKGMLLEETESCVSASFMQENFEEERMTVNSARRLALSKWGKYLHQPESGTLHDKQKDFTSVQEDLRPSKSLGAALPVYGDCAVLCQVRGMQTMMRAVLDGVTGVEQVLVRLPSEKDTLPSRLDRTVLWLSKNRDKLCWRSAGKGSRYPSILNTNSALLASVSSIEAFESNQGEEGENVEMKNTVRFWVRIRCNEFTLAFGKSPAGPDLILEIGFQTQDAFQRWIQGLHLSCNVAISIAK